MKFDYKDHLLIFFTKIITFSANHMQQMREYLMCRTI